MDEVREILDIEEKYKKLLMCKLGEDDRLSLSCPDFKYPEPVYLYVKSKKTDKTIAVRIDGGDKTVRFWDYVDDDYSDEDGVWGYMTEKGIDGFIKKLYVVMNKAIDIDFYDAEGESSDYYSGVIGVELTAETALKAARKYGKEIDFVFVKVSDFFGEKQFVFDRTFRLIKR